MPAAGKQDGQGTFKYADGTMHTGQYKDGTRNGPGTFRFADGAEHTGEYRNDRMYDYCRGCLFQLCTHPSSQFSVRHGWGTFKFSNGDVYTGEFLNGMQHGRGTLVYADGRREDGEFKNDKFLTIPLVPSDSSVGDGW